MSHIVDFSTQETWRAVCPYCGHEHESSWDWEDGQHECCGCGKTFEMESHSERVYSTRRVYRCETCNRDCVPRKDGTARPHWKCGTTENCPGGKAVEQ